MAFSANTAPGVYIDVVDRSQTTAVVSQYLPGMVGVAEKGPFDTPTPVSSFTDFVNKFGRTIPNNYLATAASIICNLSDGATIVRVGNRYTATASAASGSLGDNKVYTPQTNLFSANDYVRVSQAGKSTTVNGRVLNVFPNAPQPYFTIVNTGVDAVTLADAYTSANVDVSPSSDAANEAEGFLASYSYTSCLKDGGVQLTCDGNKNSYQIQVSGLNGASVNASDVISAGDILKITQTGRTTTREILVLQVRADNTIFFETYSRSDIGYQAIALQDSYVSSSITPPMITKVVLDDNGFPVTVPNTVYISASSEGTWANADTSADGVQVQVQPGSNPDTKKFLVYVDGTLSETIDNLTFTDPTLASYAPTVINGNSVNINVTVNSNVEPPANSRQPWNLTIASVLNVTGLQNGFNGENAALSDYIGTLDPSTSAYTGLQAFSDTENTNVNMIMVPGKSDVSILNELAIVAQNANMMAIADVPFGLTATEAIDWHNGNGVYDGQGRINSPYLAIYWNWFTTTDPFTGQAVWTPPSVGAARCFAYTYNNFKPWFAAAGDKRGLIPEALSLQFPRVPLAVRNAMYGNGNCVNPIVFYKGVGIEVEGELTMQIANSKLSAVHTMNLLNYIVVNYSVIGRRYVFEPNDPTLLAQITSDGNTFLQTIANEQGIEGWSLECDSGNNTPADRNARQANVDMEIIPIDALERLNVTLGVNASGATLVSVS